MAVPITTPSLTPRSTPSATSRPFFGGIVRGVQFIGFRKAFDYGAAVVVVVEVVVVVVSGAAVLVVVVVIGVTCELDSALPIG